LGWKTRDRPMVGLVTNDAYVAYVFLVKLQSSRGSYTLPPIYHPSFAQTTSWTFILHISSVIDRIYCSFHQFVI
jgi:hypothetical protein